MNATRIESRDSASLVVRGRPARDPRSRGLRRLGRALDAPSRVASSAASRGRRALSPGFDDMGIIGRARRGSGARCLARGRA